MPQAFHTIVLYPYKGNNLTMRTWLCVWQKCVTKPASRHFMLVFIIIIFVDNVGNGWWWNSIQHYCGIFKFWCHLKHLHLHHSASRKEIKDIRWSFRQDDLQCHVVNHLVIKDVVNELHHQCIFVTCKHPRTRTVLTNSLQANLRSASISLQTSPRDQTYLPELLWVQLRTNYFALHEWMHNDYYNCFINFVFFYNYICGFYSPVCRNQLPATYRNLPRQSNSTFNFY